MCERHQSPLVSQTHTHPNISIDIKCGYGLTLYYSIIKTEEDTVIEKNRSEDNSDVQIKMKEGAKPDGVITGHVLHCTSILFINTFSRPYHKCLATFYMHLSCCIGN